MVDRCHLGTSCKQESYLQTSPSRHWYDSFEELIRQFYSYSGQQQSIREFSLDHFCQLLWSCFVFISQSQVGQLRSFHTAPSACRYAAWCSAPQAWSSGIQLMMYFFRSRIEYTPVHLPFLACKTMSLISFASSSTLVVVMAINRYWSAVEHL